MLHGWGVRPRTVIIIIIVFPYYSVRGGGASLLRWIRLRLTILFMSLLQNKTTGRSLVKHNNIIVVGVRWPVCTLQLPPTPSLSDYINSFPPGPGTGVLMTMSLYHTHARTHDIVHRVPPSQTPSSCPAPPQTQCHVIFTAVAEAARARLSLSQCLGSFAPW